MAERHHLKHWPKEELIEEVLQLHDYVKILLKRLHPEDYE